MTKQDLLLSGWHCLYQNGVEEWVHPEFDCRVSLKQAKIIQKEYKFDDPLPQSPNHVSV